MARRDAYVANIPPGTEFGMLTVKEKIEAAGKSKYRCLCRRCGNEKIVYGYNLLRGHRTCGCGRGHAEDCKSYSIEVGQEFEYLTVIGPMTRIGVVAAYPCRCRCGNEKVVLAWSLLGGNTKSCGCRAVEELVKRSSTHGCTRSRLYNIWTGMKSRCYNPNSVGYENYGGRGIRICDEWRDDFVAFRDWAMANGYAEDLTIERADNDGNYCRENCSLIPRGDQGKNKRTCIYKTAWGETKSVVEWSKDPRCPVRYDTLLLRHRNGWDDQELVETPLWGHGTTFCEAWGEKKSLTSWWRDERCRVGKETLRRRINEGWSPEEAMSKPPRY